MALFYALEVATMGGAQSEQAETHWRLVICSLYRGLFVRHVIKCQSDCFMRTAAWINNRIHASFLN